MVRPELAPYRAWIEGFDPRAVETGMELVRRWGIRPRQADPGQMWAYVLEEVGGPFVARQLSRPEPGPGQVRLKVRASGVCGTDVHLWEGRFPVPLPIVAGHEPVGAIEALGPGVEGLALGDRVGVPWMQSGCGTCDECARDRSKYCQGMTTWIHNGGAFAEAMIVEAAGCIPIPDAVSWTAAAPLFCAGFTVMSGYRRGRPRPDDRVAVVGLGGLGHLAIQIAAAHGHEVVAITRDRTKARDAIGLGAHEVQVATDHPGQELATSGGADLILSTTDVERVLSGVVREVVEAFEAQIGLWGDRRSSHRPGNGC